MNNNYILTIGIPTYNGEKTIRDTLDSLVDQFDSFLLENVEVLISDNKSTDKTLQIVNAYIKLFPENIRIVTNERDDLELDGNLINLFNNANGQYLWIMSDDDAFEKNALLKVTSCIVRNGSCSVFFTNYSECDTNLNYLDRRFRLDIDHDFRCSNGDEFFVESKVLFGLISSLIFKVEDWQKANLSKYIGLNSLHVGALIEILADKESYIISEKTVKLRIGNTSWGENGTFIFPILDIVSMFKKMHLLGYKLSTEKFLVDHFYTNNLKSIILAKYAGLQDFNLAHKKMKYCYGRNISYWLVHFPVLYLPNKLITVGINFLKTIKKHVK